MPFWKTRNNFRDCFLLPLPLPLFHSFCPIPMTKTTWVGLLLRTFITSLNSNNSNLALHEFKILSRPKPNQFCRHFEYRPVKGWLFKMSPSLVLHWIIQVDTFLALLNNLSSLLTGRCENALKFYVPKLVCYESATRRKVSPTRTRTLPEQNRTQHKTLPERSGKVHSWWCLEGGGGEDI